MADTFADINNEWAANPGDPAAFNKRLVSAIGTADAGALAQQEAQARSQLNDPQFGQFAQERLNAINARRASLGGRTAGASEMGISGPAPNPTSTGTTTGRRPPLPPLTPGAPVAGTGYTQNGQWTPQDDSITPRLNGLLASDNPLMQQARTRGAEQASSRGLLNSTIGETAGESAAISAALPIAQQEASQTSQKNLSLQGAYQNGLLADRQAASSENIAGMQIDSQQAMQQNDIAALASRQAAQLASDQANARLNAETQKGIATGNNDTQLAVTDRNNANQVAVTGMNNQTQKSINDANNQTAVTTTGMGNATQQTISGNQIKANDTNAVITAIQNNGNNLQNAINTINNNPNIPDKARAEMIREAQNNYLATGNLINQVLNVKLDWGTLMPKAA